jgi:hypothetical protein
LISFNVLSIKNPSQATYPVGITLKLASVCSFGDFNNLCSYYKSVKYLTFAATPGSIPSTGTNYGSLAFSPNIVSATNSNHTLSAGVSLAVGDLLKVIYYPEVTVPATCSLVSNGICHSYPL